MNSNQLPNYTSRSGGVNAMKIRKEGEIIGVCVCVCIYIVGIISFFEYDVDSYEEFYYKVENMMALRVLRIYDKKKML